MSRFGRYWTVAALMFVAVGCLASLAGCGGSSSPKIASGAATTGTAATSSTTTAGASTPATSATATRTNKPPGALKQALAGYEACMRGHGVQIPLRTRISSETSTEVKARKQASSACRPVLRAALRTLAHNRRRTAPASPATAPAGSRTGSAGTSSAPTPTSTVPHIKRAATPAPVTAAFKHFTACMREHGITNFPEPEGAAFNVSHVHLNQNSAQFKAAEKACNPILNAVA